MIMLTLITILWLAYTAMFLHLQSVLGIGKKFKLITLSCNLAWIAVYSWVTITWPLAGWAILIAVIISNIWVIATLRIIKGA